MKLLRDKTIGFLDSALAEIQLREWEARKCHEFIFADGLHSAWKFIADMRTEYVNQKAKRNPYFGGAFLTAERDVRLYGSSRKGRIQI